MATDWNDPFLSAVNAETGGTLKQKVAQNNFGTTGFPGSAAYTDPNAPKPYTGTYAGGWGQALGPGSSNGPGRTSNPYPGQNGPPTGGGPFTTNKAAQNAWEDVGARFFAPTNLDNFYKGHSTQFDQPGWSEKLMSSLGPDFFNTPGAGEQFWNSIAGKFSGGAPSTMNNAYSAYKDYMGDRPNISSEPGFGAYYDNAEKRATDTLNQTFAARGAYGSSVSQGQIGQTIGDLEADRAKNEADYNLKRLAEQRAWDTVGGALASSADRSDLLGKEFGLDFTKTGMAGASMAEQQHLARVAMGLEAATSADREKLARLGMGAEIAGATDSGDLSHLSAGMNAALGVEGLSNREVQDAFNNLQTPMNLLFGGAGQAYGDLIGGDAQSLSTLLSLLTGKAGQDVSEGYRTQQTGTADLMGLVNILKSMGAFGQPQPAGGSG